MGDFDIVLCGKQTTDGDTAQVGPETAEFLHMPHAANVRTVEAAESGWVRYVAALDNKVVTATVVTPCLLCTDAEINTPRLPSYRKKCATEKSKGSGTDCSVRRFRACMQRRGRWAVRSPASMASVLPKNAILRSH